KEFGAAPFGGLVGTAITMLKRTPCVVSDRLFTKLILSPLCVWINHMPAYGLEELFSARYGGFVGARASFPKSRF
ncbi:hypothetical protein, partial [Roseibium sp. RKSG952]|uniref:hypothetical protein n=1 Tax=Roseibium sp. RKSG952 TaxID=2529384 RepID=UPI001AD8E432